MPRVVGVLRRTSIAFAALASLAFGGDGSTLTDSEPWYAGVRAFTALERLPYVRSGVETRQFSSYDRAGDNYDADYFPLYVEADGSQVLFDAYGPGCLYRLHLNLWNGDLTGVDIRFTFDDEAKPRIAMDVTKFFSDENPLGLFKAPFAYIGTGYRVLYHPFFFAKRLKITLSKEPLGVAPSWDWFPWKGRYDEHPHRRNHWFNISFHEFAEDPGIRSWSAPADLSQVATLWDPAHIGAPPIHVATSTTKSASTALEPASKTKLFELKGEGTVLELHMSLEPADVNSLFDTWLEITFDGAKTPQVEAPVGALFGVYRTAIDRRITSMFVGTKERDLYCYLPMPFWSSAVVELDNRGTRRVDHVDARIVTSAPPALGYPKDECGYLHTVYQRESPRAEGHDYRYLDLRGRGQVIGHLAYRWDTSMEEDERTYFDDAATPRIYGEGYEDDHNQGWGLKDFTHPIWGSVASDGGSGAPWRFLTPDLYVFESAVRFGHQVYGPHSPLGHEGLYRVGTEESVAFAYVQDREGLALTDELDVGNATSESKHSYRVLGTREERKGSWWYDGEQNNVLFRVAPIDDDGVATEHGSEFKVAVDPENRGVRLRRRTDKDDNRQLARVWVDGTLVTERPWYSVDFEHVYRDIRWLDSDFEIPSRYTKGKRQLTIRIEPLSSKTGRWEEFRYWIFSRR